MKEKIHKKAAGLFKKKPLKIFLIVILALVVLGGTTFVIANKTGIFGKKATVQQLTARVDKGSIEQIIEGSGSVKSATRKEISSKVVSTIQTINFKTGDEVKTGDVMFELENTDALVNIEDVKNSIEEANLSLQDVQESIAALTVKAPFSGYVNDFTLKVEDSVNGGGNVATITDTSKLKITLPFSGKKVAEIAEGQKAVINIEELMQSLQGTVTYVGEKSYATGGVQAYDIEIMLDNPGTLDSGMTANAEISIGSETYASIESSTLEYANNKVVKNTSGGKVKSVNIKKNEYVNAGDVLVVLENDSLQSNLSSVQLKLKNLQSQLAIQEKKLTYYTLTAPCNGTITSQDVALGDTVSAGSTLSVVSDMDTLEFSVSIDELDISDIKVGLEVTVTADAIADTAKNPLSGKVSEVSMEGTSSNGVTTYPVTITLDKSDKLKTGMNVNGEIFIASKDDVLRVPVEAIKTINEVTYVYVKGANSNQTSNKASNGNMPQPPSGNTQTQSGASSTDSLIDGSTKQAGQPPNPGADTSSGVRPSPPAQGSQQGMPSRAGNTSAVNGDSYYSNATLLQVETGISNETYIEILSGLTEGQEVVLPQAGTDSESSDEADTQQNMNGMGAAGMQQGGGTPPQGGGGGPGF